jgi:hypothetical protein
LVPEDSLVEVPVYRLRELREAATERHRLRARLSIAQDALREIATCRAFSEQAALLAESALKRIEEEG